MPTLDEFLKLAADSYRQARASSNSLARAGLNVMSDDYLKQADELQRGRSAVQAVFPKQQITPPLQDCAIEQKHEVDRASGSRT